MSLLGNLIWLLFGGLFVALIWVIVGLFWCITIIGIPVGLQCFKFASLSLAPFGKDIIIRSNTTSFLINILWLFLGGIEIAIPCVVIGLIFCITIVGIPFGLQFFKLAKLALMPFGAEIVSI